MERFLIFSKLVSKFMASLREKGLLPPQKNKFTFN